MKLHERITQLITALEEGKDRQDYYLCSECEGIIMVDRSNAYRDIGADVLEKVPLSDLPDFILTYILLDPVLKRDFTHNLQGYGGKVATERKDYRLFVYADIFKVVATVGDKDWVGFEWSDGDTECLVSMPTNCLGILGQKFWDDLRLWPDFNKEFLIHVLGSHGFRYIPQPFLPFR